LIIPEGVTTVGNYAFKGCSGFNGILLNLSYPSHVLLLSSVVAKDGVEVVSKER
jgi:hypothetical protein